MAARSAVLLLAFVLSIKAAEFAPFNKLQYQFELFTAKYQKTYANPEEERERSIAFRQTLNVVETINEANQGYWVGINEFADRTPAEMNALLTPLTTPLSGPEMVDVRDAKALPATWDWRKENVVTPVANQGQCASASAFAAVDALSSCHAIDTKNMVPLSVQNIIDCTMNGGCNGGLDPSSVFSYVQRNGGIDGEACYHPATNGSCQYTAACCASKLTGYSVITSGNEKTLQAAVYQTPVAAGIDASHVSFQMYSGGIYYEPACSSTNIDHVLLIVGYGTDDNKQDYWIAKNSWGTSWGMEGYILLARNRGNNCGVASFAAVPQGCPSCTTVAQVA